MEEDEGNSPGVHSPASERGTLVDISTHPNPYQAMGTLHNQASQEVQEELPRGGLYTGHIVKKFANRFTIMGSKILLVCIYRLIGAYPVQEKVMQE